MPLRISISWGKASDPAPADMAASEPELAAAVLYEVAAQRLYEQMGRNDALDSKAAVAFSYGGTVLPITFGLLSISDRDLARCAWFWPLLYGAVGAYLLVLFVSAWAYLIRRMSLRPYLPTLQEYGDSLDNDSLRRWTAQEYLLSIGTNEQRLGRKAQLVGFALMLSIVEAVLLTAAALTVL